MSVTKKKKKKPEIQKLIYQLYYWENEGILVSLLLNLDKEAELDFWPSRHKTEHMCKNKKCNLFSKWRKKYIQNKGVFMNKLHDSNKTCGAECNHDPILYTHKENKNLHKAQDIGAKD